MINSSTIWSIVRVPSQRRRISLAGPSVSITRSGPSSTHALRVLSKWSRTPGARRGRSGSGIASGIKIPGNKGAWWNQTWCDIGVVQRVQHAPQHIALECERVDDCLLLFDGLCMLLHPFERKIRVTLGLRRALIEIRHDLRGDEVV